jgi:hypothetical protein
LKEWKKKVPELQPILNPPGLVCILLFPGCACKDPLVPQFVENSAAGLEQRGPLIRGISVRRVDMRYLRFLLLAGGLVFLTFSAEGNCATIAAKSSSQTDVQSAIDAASSGDIVAIPAGSSTWSSRVNIPDGKKITLQGQGHNSTTISGGGINMNMSGSRVTGIGFTFNGGNLIEVKGKGWRIDNCRFTNTSSANAVGVFASGLNVTVSPSGVVDHCIFNYCKVFVNGMGNFNSISAQWAADLGLGTDDAVYVEDCTFNYDGRGNCMDTNRGGKYVFRYNTVTQSRLEVHSLQSDVERASRKWEIYNNTIKSTSSMWGPMFIRGGTGVVFNNNISGPWSDRNIILDNVRSCSSIGSAGNCNGSSSWDGNSSGGAGYPCRDQIGRSTDQSLWTTSNPYPAQALDPAYFWNNKYSDGSNIEITLHGCSASQSHLKQNRDWFSGTPKPGYTPYIYPHPLVTGGGTVIATPTPGAPSSLRIQ